MHLPRVTYAGIFREVGGYGRCAARRGPPGSDSDYLQPWRGPPGHVGFGFSALARRAASKRGGAARSRSIPRAHPGGAARGTGIETATLLSAPLLYGCAGACLDYCVLSLGLRARVYVCVCVCV